MNRLPFSKIILAFLLLSLPQKGHAQILDLELQRKDLERCSIIDSVNNDYRGNVGVYYYDLDTEGNRKKRGHREFTDGRLYGFAWISEDNLFSVAGDFFENGQVASITIRAEGLYTNIISYHDNGYLYGSFYFDQNNLEHGWHVWFDRSGNLEQKAFYEHGKRISSEIMNRK
jgi:hypothetical protein